MKRLSTKECGNCGGTGEVPDEKAAAMLRSERIKREIQAKDVADYIGVSPSYLYDLEKGNRTMTNEQAERYQKALEELVAARV